MSPKEEAEVLLSAVMPFAERMLREYGEFYPFGASLKPEGEVVHVGAADPATDRPKSKYLIDTLVSSFQGLAVKKSCKAVAIVFDVKIPAPGSGERRDAIQVNLDHEDDYSVEVFFPYELVEREPILGTAFAQLGKGGIFRAE